MLQEADDNYYITVKSLLELSNRAYEIFESSEVVEKRQIINFVLSNIKLDGKKLYYDLIKPFDSIVNFSDSHKWLRG